MSQRTETPVTDDENIENRDHLWLNAFRVRNWDFEGLESFLGPNLTAYFSFMSRYSSFLALPALLSLFVFLFDTRSGTINSRVPMAFGVFMFALWGPAFVGTWSRELSDAARKKSRIERKESERREDFDPRDRNSYSNIVSHYAVSVLATAASLGLVALAVVLVFNLEGYFRDENSSIFYWRFVNSFRNSEKPGVVYDDDYFFIRFLPVVFHTILIISLNKLYSKVAVLTTEYENHETRDGFEKSVLIKKMFFHFVNRFLSLFYLAFYAHDIVRLQKQMIGLFLVDTVRRLAVESVIPFIQYRYLSKIGDKDTPQEEHKPEYESDFADMSEMLIQYAYLLIFASVFPLASFFAFIANAVEIRSDLFKFLFVFRFKKTMSSHMPLWISFFKFVTYAAAFTNALLYALSDQHDRIIFVILEHIGLISTFTILRAAELFPKVIEEKEKAQ